jgi:hypothetical protein
MISSKKSKLLLNYPSVAKISSKNLSEFKPASFHRHFSFPNGHRALQQQQDSADHHSTVKRSGNRRQMREFRSSFPTTIGPQRQVSTVGEEGFWQKRKRSKFWGV